MIPALVQSLVSQSPVLVVYVVGMILALVFWGRCPGAAGLTLAALLLLLVLAIGQTYLNLHLNFSRFDRDVDERQQLAMASTVMNLVASLLRAGALALLLAAVFSGRRAARPTLLREAPRPTVAPAPHATGSQDITRMPGD
jgi:hypothetical protein